MITERNKQEYRSGHNEAVLKTVWVKAHGGSNPSACATNKKTDFCSVFFVCTGITFRGGIRGWEPFCESKTLCPIQFSFSIYLTAKDAIDNGGAGRAAKSALPGRSLARYSGRSLHSLFRRYAPYATLLTPTTKIGYLCEINAYLPDFFVYLMCLCTAKPPFFTKIATIGVCFGQCLHYFSQYPKKSNITRQPDPESLAKMCIYQRR